MLKVFIILLSISLLGCKNKDIDEKGENRDRIGPIVTTATSITTTTTISVVTPTTSTTTTTRRPVVTTTTSTTTTTRRPVVTTTTSTTTTSYISVIRIPERAGVLVSNCHNNLNYNTCIFNLNNTLNNNYAVNILDTINNFLENLSYKITIESLERATLVNGKWTKPYRTDPNYTISQANLYHWLMYQKEWMELNTNKWYASDKEITVDIENRTNGSAYWSSSSNNMTFPRENDLFWALFHEAGHANLYYSKGQYTHGQKHQVCASDTSSTSSRCCQTYKGCFDAISEGQAEFHQYLIDLTGTKTGFENNKIYRCGHSTSITLKSKAQNIYNECNTSYPKGQIHTIGFLVYATTWAQIFEHESTNKKDIAILFSEHLPLLTGDDDFETAKTKIINLAKQIFESETGNDYADIISEAFNNRGL